MNDPGLAQSPHEGGRETDSEDAIPSDGLKTDFFPHPSPSARILVDFVDGMEPEQRNDPINHQFEIL